jgi:hypothetical protein
MVEHSCQGPFVRSVTTQRCDCGQIMSSGLGAEHAYEGGNIIDHEFSRVPELVSIKSSRLALTSCSNIGLKPQRAPLPLIWCVVKPKSHHFHKAPLASYAKQVRDPRFCPCLLLLLLTTFNERYRRSNYYVVFVNRSDARS